jgi:Fe-S cluster biogenesis protein NfuA
MFRQPELIKITAEPSVVSNICKFTVSETLLENKTFRCTTEAQAQGSPLLEGLMKLQGVEETLVANNTVTVRKGDQDEWRILARLVGGEIRKALAEHERFLAEDLAAERLEEPESVDLSSPLAQGIQKLLVEQINPSIASHGGHVTLREIKGDTVYVEMGGGCQGCAMSNATLKQGVERLLKANYPEIQQVLDVTDHTKGINPYYTNSER